MAEQQQSFTLWYPTGREDMFRIREEASDYIIATTDGGGHPEIEVFGYATQEAHAHLIAAAPRLFKALAELSDLFALPGENSVERFERLAAMFRKDTGYLAPGKDQPMCGPDQPDGNELRAIYDAWYQAKIDRARAALASAQAAK
jgi:hypothetical protein